MPVKDYSEQIFQGYYFIDVRGAPEFFFKLFVHNKIFSVALYWNYDDQDNCFKYEVNKKEFLENNNRADALDSSRTATENKNAKKTNVEKIDEAFDKIIEGLIHRYLLKKYLLFFPKKVLGIIQNYCIKEFSDKKAEFKLLENFDNVPDEIEMMLDQATTEVTLRIRDLK